jgi:pyridoxal biosynthesis lyase PdxS
MIRPRSVFLTATVAVLAAAPPAVADDAGVFNAYVARQASEVDPGSDAYLRASERVGKAKTARAARRAFRAVIRANQQINGALRRIEADIEALPASSANGTTARREALKEVRGWQLANRLESRVIRRILAGKRVNVRRELRRPNKIMRRVYRNGRRAVRNFNAVGLASPVGAVSAK